MRGMMTMALVANISKRQLIILNMPGFKQIGKVNAELIKEIDRTPFLDFNNNVDAPWTRSTESLLPDSPDYSPTFKQHPYILRTATNYFLVPKLEKRYGVKAPPLPELMQSLFRPNAMVQHLVNTTLQTRILGRPFLGLHLRLGNHSPWYDPPRIPASGVNEFIKCALSYERHKFPNRSIDVAWYVTSDAPWVTQHFQLEFGRRKIVTSEVLPVHVDREPSDFQLELETSLIGKKDAGGGKGSGINVYHTVAEHIILSLADHLIISPSGFSVWAAHRTGKQANMYPFKEPCIPS